MPDLRLQSLGEVAPGIARYLSASFGCGATVDGGDVVIPQQEAGLLRTGDILTLHNALSLSEDQFSSISGALAGQIPEDVKQYELEAPTQTTVSEGYGALSEFERVSFTLGFAPWNKAAEVLENQTLPFMAKHFQCTRVCGVSVDSSTQQKNISATKIALLGSHFDLETTNRLVSQKNAMQGILPEARHLHDFVTVLTRFSPYCLTLPMSRQGVTWHFIPPAMVSFPYLISHGLFNSFSARLAPIAEAGQLTGISGLKDMHQDNIWRLLRFVVRKLNALLAYINDFSNFTDDEGVVDLERKTQAYGAIYLLFADLSEISASSNSHRRISFSMSALDKLANLRKSVGRLNRNEGKVFANFCSRAQQERLKILIKQGFGELDYSELSRVFCDSVDQCYDAIHEHLSSNFEGAASQESKILDRLRSMRNLRHGAYLDRDQFQELFFTSAGTVPSHLVALPWLLTFGLISNTSAFLNADPCPE